MRQGSPYKLLIACAALAASACAVEPQLSVRLDARGSPVFTPSLSVRQASGPRARRGPAVAARAAATAQRMLGTPYQYGGHSPAAGFDCSGLVYYSYGRAGALVPRTSRDQFRASRPLALHEARPGDLVFFRIGGKVSHVGIYLADCRFVHAPSKGKQVQIASLQSGYYQRNFLRAGRLPAAERSVWR